MKQPKVLMLNSLGIRCCSKSKMAAQSCLQGFNQQIFFSVFRLVVEILA